MMTLSSSKRLLVRPSYPSNKLLFKINLGFRGAQVYRLVLWERLSHFASLLPPLPLVLRLLGAYFLRKLPGKVTPPS